MSGLNKDHGKLIHMLHDTQKKFGYIPAHSISQISGELKISESEIFGVLTFYKAFALEPRGRHLITICMGTACHVRGGVQIVEEMERKLNIKVGKTTANRKFTLETVNCLGCCAIGPVVVVNGKYYSNITIKKVDAILKEYQESE
ncbi:MAG TPA: NAD(P)H-dependent oxidoreductase subunit E [Candidatus Aminicenantes bacterium]|jgi:NADH-quinone oxidoreductase subunit E|nr:NAD(P)H-dependent oxidoreductase subunit E [Candidatus Aminicenantes bacterium]